MKNWKTLLASILAVGMLAGCSKEIDGPQLDPIDTNDAAYMNVNIALPSAAGTRAGNGEEAGQDYENNISKILLILTRTDNSYATHGIVDKLSVAGKATVTTTAKISSTEIKRFYDDAGNFIGDGKVNVFAICNPTQEIIDTVEQLEDKNSEWFDKIGEIAKEDKGKNAGIWTDNYFLMTNSHIATKQFPRLFKEWQTKYSSEVTPFNLSGDNDNGGGISNGGAIRVERVAARFDFKDGSAGNNTYDIGLGDDAGKMKVQLVRMALVNMNQSFYYLRRVSADGTKTDAALCGAETAENYVVSTEDEFKKGNLSDPANIAALHGKFHFPLYSPTGTIDDNTRTQWDSYLIADVLKGGEDIDEGWNATDKTGYRIWRYVTENTIPGTDTQRTGITTGVVFKGKLLVGEAEGLEKLKTAVDGAYVLPEGKNGYTYQVDGKTYPILYLFQNQLYVGWNDEVTQFAEANEKSELAEAMKAVDENGKSVNEYYQDLADHFAANADSKTIEAALTAFRKAATAAGFTLYQASSDDNEGAGYYFYYYYWNRHNDNGLPSTMGKMEFGVVRNNIYKLAVTGISKLGHPRITDNDPDPENPDDPDENGDIYLSVSVEVLPWTVRVNNIEF